MTRARFDVRLNQLLFDISQRERWRDLDPDVNRSERNNSVDGHDESRSSPSIHTFDQQLELVDRLIHCANTWHPEEKRRMASNLPQHSRILSIERSRSHSSLLSREVESSTDRQQRNPIHQRIRSSANWESRKRSSDRDEAPSGENRFYLSTMWNDGFWLGISKKVRHGMIVVGMSIENQRKIDSENHFCLDGELQERNYFDRVVSCIGAVILIELVWLNWAKEMVNEMSYRMMSWSFCLSLWEIKSILFSNKTSANATCLREEGKTSRTLHTVDSCSLFYLDQSAFSWWRSSW